MPRNVFKWNQQNKIRTEMINFLQWCDDDAAVYLLALSRIKCK